MDYNNIVRPLPIFDKIYTSYSELCNNAEKDGVFVGRFVIIQEDEPGGYNNTVWQKVSNGESVNYQLVADWDPITNSIIQLNKKFPFENSDAALVFSEDEEGKYSYVFKPAGQVKYEVSDTSTTLTSFSEELLKAWAAMQAKFNEYEKVNSNVVIARWKQDDDWSSINEIMP